VTIANRLCAEAGPGQILVAEPVCAAAEDCAIFEPLRDIELKGLSRAVAVFNVGGLK
jgi:class 3 adenylate cyclase